MKTLPNVSSRYGAPMGRSDNIVDADLPLKFHMQRLKWVDGDYDQGGAYWGGGCGDAIYWAYADGPEEVNEIFVRASTREQAKLLVLEHFPQAKFYR